nr:citrate synthase [uncultured Cupriavidus sp.]
MTQSQKKPVAKVPLPPREGIAQTYVTAEQAAQALGIKQASLYTYVSRGLIRSVLQPGSRSRLYYREDVERATMRIGGRAGRPETVEAVMSWGHPVFHTLITDLTDEGPFYRGQSAIALAECDRGFESVAELLWDGLDQPGLAHWDTPRLPEAFFTRLSTALDGAVGLTGLRIMSIATSLFELDGSGHSGFDKATTTADARVLLQIYAAAMGLMGPGRQYISHQNLEPSSVASVLLTALGVPITEAALRALNAALILCADHELSSATLSARVAASCGANLTACLVTAIATHSGSLVIGGCEKSEHLLRKAHDTEEMYQLLSELERSGSYIPGYNLKAYPKGDPRARKLLALAASLGTETQPVLDLVTDVGRRFDLEPSLEIGLVSLAMALRFPPGTASIIWALARASGWVAHIIEQREAGFMLRPRARYIGPPTR